ncbi:MAG: DUF192 domain-containing protein [Acidimicrobiales bacterium]
MAWLLREGEVLASLEIAASRRDRAAGLLGRSGIEGALLIEAARSVHTIGMKFPIDVAFVDADGVVLRTRTLRPWRLTMPVRGASRVVEAEAGTFASWDLQPGDKLEVNGEELSA